MIEDTWGCKSASRGNPPVNCVMGTQWWNTLGREALLSIMSDNALIFQPSARPNVITQLVSSATDVSTASTKKEDLSPNNCVARGP